MLSRVFIYFFSFTFSSHIILLYILGGLKSFFIILCNPVTGQIIFVLFLKGLVKGFMAPLSKLNSRVAQVAQLLLHL